jgi:hypothetical protein
MLPGKLSNVLPYSIILNQVKRIVVDLMSVEPVDKSSGPVWLFVSVAFGWIAHADIHTENWRYNLTTPELTIDSLETLVSLQELEYKCFSRRGIPVP